MVTTAKKILPDCYVIIISMKCNKFLMKMFLTHMVMLIYPIN